MSDSTGVSVSLDEISLEGNKSWESNIGDSDNTRDGGKIAGRAITTWGGGTVSYACMTSIFESSCKGKKTSMYKRYLVKSFEESGEMLLDEAEKKSKRCGHFKDQEMDCGAYFEEKFSLVVDIKAIRFLVAIAAYYDNEIWQMDVKTAFLNGYLNEKVYMEQPEGFVNPKYPNWRYCMENSKRGSIPMQEKLKLSKSKGALTPAELEYMHNVPYASVVGSIMYAVRCTRPDVAFAQNTRYVFVLNGGVVDQKSANQSIFASSSVEAEYITAFDVSKEDI
nr:zinc finger, CCHC-type [Tanacetum cinerariifolium]